MERHSRSPTRKYCEGAMPKFSTPDPPHAGLSRRSVLQGAVAPGALGYGADAAPSAAEQKSPVSKPMTYIGTATSRIDGHAKVTGGAKYAAEFNVPGLVHAFIVESTIAKGRILHVDASEALRVEGVIDVLTHEKRPRMANTDDAYKDDVAPEGAPYRPLYDSKIMFSGQPVALVLAEEWEIARFAASLVRVEYEQEAHVTDLYHQREVAFALPEPAKPRGNAAKAFAAADVGHQGEYYVPIEHHNPMEPYASTV